MAPGKAMGQGNTNVTVKTHDDARSLIVVSRDYGELGLAMSLVRGQAFARRTRMLLPDVLYADNEKTLPIPVSPYATLEDILDVVDSHQPHLVFLFSGYLISNDWLLSRESLDALLQQLQDRGCGIITSDPFLGLSSRLTPSQVDTRTLVSGRPLLSRWLLRFLLRSRSPGKQVLPLPSLENVVHLYPTSIPDTKQEDSVTRLSFFNPTIIRAAADAHVASGGSGRRDTDDGRSRWLFVLSATDLECQRILLGLSQFARLLARMLQRTLDAGKRPTLIGPPSMVEILSNGLSDEIELLPQCPFAEFEARLLGAEYVFYWNAFSFSLLLRIVNELPVFLFDRGHLAQLSWLADATTSKPFYDVALSCHFGGWVPPYLDQKQRLDPGLLAESAQEQRPAMRVIRERLQRSATPDEQVDHLLRDHGPGSD